jgi:prepilin-type N-terminal cleavage/methylation domain-containing protein
MRSRSRLRSGFTLLELLLAAALSTVLLAGLWRLFSMYDRLFTTAETRVQQAHLARALMQQLTEDLHAAIPDVSPSIPGGTATVRRFGLFGTREALQVDVLQVTAAQAAAVGSDMGTEMARSPNSRRPRAPQAPELHTVRYTFQAATVEDSSGPETACGLVRRELDWETPASEADAPPEAEAVEEGRSAGPREPGGSTVEDLLAISQGSGSATWAPEVVGLEFRYFDGSGWSDQWDSIARKSLPVAVEAVLRVASLDDARRSLPRPAAAETAEEAGAAPPGPARAAVQTHRVLVYLASTGLDHGPQRPEPGPAPTVLPVAAPLAPPVYHAPLPPPRVPAAPSRNLPLPDQWMRSGS